MRVLYFKLCSVILIIGGDSVILVLDIRLLVSESATIENLEHSYKRGVCHVCNDGVIAEIIMEEDD